MVGISKLVKPMKVKVKTRYSSPLSDAIIKPAKNGVEVIFIKPEWAISPGQAVVFYKGKEVLGGGVIK